MASAAQASGLFGDDRYALPGIERFDFFKLAGIEIDLASRTGRCTARYAIEARVRQRLLRVLGLLRNFLLF